MNHCLIFSINNGVFDRSAGAHRIASHLRLQNWDAEVIDFVDFWKLEELQELIRSRVNENTKFFGFSFLFNRSSVDHFFSPLCDWIRKTYPDIVLISGSQAILLNLEPVHYHIVGYGEYAVIELLKYLFDGGTKPKFDIALSKGKTKVINALHSYPAYPFLNPTIKYENRDFIMPGEWGRIEFSRGCKFKCLYCNYPILGVKNDHTRTVEGAREQMLDAYDRFGIENYVVTDETFNDRTEKITKYADMVETLSWKPYFSGYIRADLLISRPKDREELLRMGFLGHFYGIETFNPDTAKIIGKGMHPEKVQKGLLEVKDYFKSRVGKKYRALIAVIGGLPKETLQSLEQTKKWLNKNWMDQVTMASALEINSLNDHRPSTLSLDYSKYGYREIFLNESDEYGEQSKSIIMHGSIKSISWENDNMNILQAAEWAEEIDNMYKLGGHDLQKIDPFYLSRILCDNKGDIISLEKKLSLVAKTSDEYYANFYKFVEEYKKKKLSI